MTRRIGLLTTDGSVLHGRDHDTVPLVQALRLDGLQADAPVWHDETVDWATYDMLVIRTPWDYSQRYGEFMTWLDRASTLTRILNAPDLIRWNIDKRYLLDLQEHGLPCIPTAFCDALQDAAAAIERTAPKRIVIKPSVSAGSRDTGLFEPGDPAALALAGRIVEAGRTVMVQPAEESVIESGENALFYFNGEYSYAFHKGPILAPGGMYVGGTYQVDISPVEPSAAEVDLGGRVLKTIGLITADRNFATDARLPLYARIDMASERGMAPQVLEVEVFEPALFVDVVPQAIGAFVASVKARLDS